MGAVRSWKRRSIVMLPDPCVKVRRPLLKSSRKFSRADLALLTRAVHFKKLVMLSMLSPFSNRSQ